MDDRNDDELWFQRNAARRYRLRNATETESERIGCADCWCVAMKGGALYVFASENPPIDSDVSCSRFLADVGFFHRHQKSDAESYGRRSLAVSLG
jgi:hypothetical protein